MKIEVAFTNVTSRSVYAKWSKKCNYGVIGVFRRTVEGTSHSNKNKILSTIEIRKRILIVCIIASVHKKKG